MRKKRERPYGGVAEGGGRTPGGDLISAWKFMSFGFRPIRKLGSCGLIIPIGAEASVALTS